MITFAEPRFHVEGWSPEYGTPLETDDTMPSPEDVVLDVETTDWRPMPGRLDPPEPKTVAFVDGVRRIDARLTLDDPFTGPVPGLCGSFGAGAVVWDREKRHSAVAAESVRRLAVLSEGRGDQFPNVGLGLRYTTDAIPGRDPGDLVQLLQNHMRNEEGRLAVRLAEAGHLVIADGTIKALEARPIVGYIKRHFRTYLPNEESNVIRQLSAGERTPLFAYDVEGYERYSWYLRLAELAGGHSWTGVVRCETMATLPLGTAIRLADQSAALLPQVASEPHRDPRAPQNLVPIGALEQHLRRLLGDPGLVYRALREALHGNG